jgi:hypothetical protein
MSLLCLAAMIRAFTLLLPLSLAACQSEPPAADINDLDAELAAGIDDNAADPLLARAVNDPIMTDPQLSQQSNADAVRPPPQPYSAPLPATTIARMPEPGAEPLMSAPAPAASCPQCKVADQSLTLGALAEAQRDRRTKGCASALSYSATWASRLPADLPLHPNARVIEAAGSTGRGCALRVVSFVVQQPVGRMVDWYYTRASRAGYSAEHQADATQHVLGGTRARDGGAYVVFLESRGEGTTAIDLVANNGR